MKRLGVELPNTVELKVTETEPGIKGDTASGGSNLPTVETGLVVNVPFFVNEGDKLIINTTDGSYVSRGNLNMKAKRNFRSGFFCFPETSHSPRSYNPIPESPNYTVII